MGPRFDASDCVSGFCRKNELEHGEDQWTEVISWEPRAFMYHNFMVGSHSLLLSVYAASSLSNWLILLDPLVYSLGYISLIYGSA